jgi:hypothetical protein
VKGIVHEPAAKLTITAETRDALLAAITKARAWIEYLRLNVRAWPGHSPFVGRTGAMVRRRRDRKFMVSIAKSAGRALNTIHPSLTRVDRPVRDLSYTVAMLCFHVGGFSTICHVIVTLS